MDGQTTLRDFLDYWLETVMRGDIRRTTYAAYRGYIRNHIVPAIGQFPLADIKPDTAQIFVNGLKTKGLANKSARAIMVMLRGSLDVAAEYDYIAKNPCRTVNLPKTVDREVRTFTVAERRRIATTAMRGNDPRYIGVLIGLYTGLRVGELCGLKYEDIDFERCRLSVNKSMKRVLNYLAGEAKSSVIIEEPKTPKSKRVIPIPRDLCGIIKRRQEESGSEYVLSRKNGMFVEPRAFQFVYERLLKEADVPYKSFHTLRHNFVTAAIELAGDVKTVSEIVGHSGIAVTLAVYAHSGLEQKEKLMDKMNVLFLETCAISKH
jgi:integrase